MDINKILKQNIVEKVFTNRFTDIMRLKRNYKGKYPLMDFGIGEDKSMPDKGILDALKQGLSKSENHKYSDDGTMEFVDAARKYLCEKHQIDLEREEIMPIMGAKSLLAMIPSLFVGKGDYIITLKPSYVVLERAAQLFEGNVFYLELGEENGFRPEFEDIPIDILKKTKIMNLNFPHNPTGAIADKEIYKEAIALAEKYNFIIINDAAYVDINYREITPFLATPGAKEVGIEIFTMSKTFNMTGFRLGFVAGNSELIKILRKLKDNYDSGQYIPIQCAGIYALSHPEINEELRLKYLKRMKKVAQVLFEHGLNAYLPSATFFLYVKVPVHRFDGKIKNAHEFAAFLLEKVGIMTIPYDESGPYIRLSMTYVADDEEAFIKDLATRLNEILD